jgi:UDP-3-O-[3-hydroxymyristoyl] glucosamine N-acyltransferase
VDNDEQRQLFGSKDKISRGWKLIWNPIEESKRKLKQLANIKKIPEILNKLK